MTTLVCSSCGTVYKTRKWKPEMDEARCECGGSRVSPGQAARSRSAQLIATPQLGPASSPRRRQPMKRGSGFKTSPAQQKATKGRACIVCGKDEAEATIDPAHVAPRRMAPHCTCEKGTVPLCRSCHSRYDDLNDSFDLLPYLMANDLREETVHGFLEHGVSLREVMDVVTGVKWVPKSELESNDELEAA